MVEKIPLKFFLEIFQSHFLKTKKIKFFSAALICIKFCCQGWTQRRNNFFFQWIVLIIHNDKLKIQELFKILDKIYFLLFEKFKHGYFSLSLAYEQKKCNRKNSCVNVHSTIDGVIKQFILKFKVGLKNIQNLRVRRSFRSVTE